MNLFIEAEKGVNGKASGDKESDIKNDDLYNLIVADNVEFIIIYQLS